MKLNFIPIRKFFHQNSKIAQIYILWTLCCQVSEKLWRKPFKYYPGTFYMEFPLMFVFTLLIWELTLLLIWDHITNNSRIIFLCRIPLKSDLSSFYIEFPCKFFFTWKSFVKFFPNLKLEIEFHSHKKVVSPKIENCTHLVIVNFKCAKFQRNQRTFLDREVGR